MYDTVKLTRLRPIAGAIRTECNIDALPVATDAGMFIHWPSRLLQVV